MNARQEGYGRRGLLLAIAALGIVAAAVAVAIVVMQQNHVLKQKFAAVVKATARYQTAIEICAQFGRCAAGGSLAGLAEGTLGIPDSITTTYVARVAVAANGTITATATRAEGLAGESYVLTPTYVKGAPIAWAASGTCKTRAAGAIC